jgi:hypothetical protein
LISIPRVTAFVKGLFYGSIGMSRSVLEKSLGFSENQSIFNATPQTVIHAPDYSLNVVNKLPKSSRRNVSKGDIGALAENVFTGDERLALFLDELSALYRKE